MLMIDRALSSGASVETLTQLMALQERWAASQARRAFDHAIAAAKAKIGPVVKIREVDFKDKDGKQTNYRHEDLAAISGAVDAPLAENGLSYRFRTSQGPSGVSVVCVLSHRDGHSEETTLAAGADTSGGKNGIQAVGSTITYLQRYTLKAALGLAVANDDDGRGAVGEDEKELSTSQVKTLRTLIRETDTVEAQFLRHVGVETVEDIPAREFQKLHSIFMAKKRRAAATQSETHPVEGATA